MRAFPSSRSTCRPTVPTTAPSRTCAGVPSRPGCGCSRSAPGVLERVADTVTPQPVLAVLPMLEEPPAGTEPWSARDGALVVVLVDVRDPGNAGTVLRAADASGSALVVFAGDSVDPYNPKTVRSSAGSLFHVPLAVRPDPAALATELAAGGIRTLATVVRDGRTTPDSTGPCRRPSSWATSPRGSPAELVGALVGHPGHPHGGAGGIAQRRRGLRGGLLRGLPATPGRRCRAT